MRTLLSALAIALSLQAQPKIQRFTLPNGLRVLHLEDHERPLVRARLQLRLEPGDTPPNLPGLPLLIMGMLGRSDAADLNAEDFDRMLEDSGIQFAYSLEPGGLSWRLVARSRDQDRALGLLADRLLRTVFDAITLETQRLACWRDEERLESAPYVHLRQMLRPDAASRPTFAGLGAITLEDLLAFRAAVMRPDRAVLVLHGDLGLEQAKRLVLLSLGSWPAGPQPPVDAQVPSAASPPEPPRIPATGSALRLQAVAARPEGLSAEASALLSLLVPGDAALPPVRIALDDTCVEATLDAEAGAPGPAAWSLFQKRLEGLRQREFTQIEVDRARDAWLARRSLEALHPEAQMDSALAEARGRGVSVDRVKAVTAGTLTVGLRNWLDPSRIRSGAAGDPKTLASISQGCPAAP